MEFKAIALVGKHKTTEVADTLNTIINHLNKNKINIILEKETSTILPTYKFPIVTAQDLNQYCELIIVVGGDGSLLDIAPYAAYQNLPILGVNLGRLGFLTDILPSNLEKIDAVLAGEYQEEKRVLLTNTVKYHNKLLTSNAVLNDVVLLSNLTGSIIYFGIYVNSEFVCDYRADGLIVTTPTGSTAHALSGGGPILHPGLEAIGIVPMLSHNLSSRPLVINDNDKIKIIFYANNHADSLIIFDGQNEVLLSPGGEINIEKAPTKLKLLHPKDYTYFETLRNKLHWEVK